MTAPRATENTEKRDRLPRRARKPVRLLFRRREALLYGLKPLAHFLKQVFELFESLFRRDSLAIASLAGLFSSISISVAARCFSTCGFLQTRDLPFDHGHHFDAQVVALQQRFQCRNGGGIATSAERVDRRHSYGKVRFAEIRRDLLGNVLV